jgi:antitoxin ChpS
MPTAKLRRVGGSTMLSIPPAVLEALDLKPDAAVELTVAGGALRVAPARPRYSLDELLAQCDPAAEPSEEERAWLDAPAVGREL